MNPEMVTAVNTDSKVLVAISEDKLPPFAVSASDLLKKVMTNGLGKIGSGLKVFMFDGRQIDRCAVGVVTVNYLDEQYEFQTPLPGCE